MHYEINSINAVPAIHSLAYSIRLRVGLRHKRGLVRPWIYGQNLYSITSDHKCTLGLEGEGKPWA